MKRKRGWVRVFVVNLAGVLIGWGLLELWFGGRTINPLSIPRNVELRFNIQYLYNTPDGPTVTYRRDEYGLRGRYADPGSIEILTVGGSTTDQRYLDDQRTWQSVLQRAFARDGREVEVVNAGVDGQSTVGNLANFEYWFPKIPGLHAQFVLVYVGTNDFFLDASGARLFDDLQPRSVTAAFLKQSAIYDLYRRLRGAYLARWVFDVEHGGLRLSQASWTSKGVRPEDEWRADATVAARLGEFGERLRLLDDRIRRFGSRAIFVVQKGHHFKWTAGRVVGIDREWALFGHPANGVDIAHLVAMQTARTMEICESLAAVCVDAAASGLDDGDFYDVVHNTPSGAEKVGLAMYESIEKYF